MKRPEPTKIQRVRTLLKKSAHDIESAMLSVRRGSHSAVSEKLYVDGYKALFKALDELTDAVDRLEQEKKQ